MADVRIIIVVGIFILLLSFGAVWISVGGGQSSSGGYNAFDVASLVGGYVGGQEINPPSYQATDFNAYTQAVLPPLMVGSPELDAAILAIPAAFVMALASLARWKLSLPAGILGAAGGVLWTLGVPGIAREAGDRLAAWPGFNGRGIQMPVGSSLGPYIAVVGGALLIVAYLLTTKERLDTPVDDTFSIPSTK